MANERIRGVEDVTMRAIVLLELDYPFDTEITLQVLHVRRRGAAERINRLVIVADCKYRVARRMRTTAWMPAGQQAQPLILQTIGVLELIDEDVAEALTIMVAQDFVAREQLVAAQ